MKRKVWITILIIAVIAIAIVAKVSFFNGNKLVEEWKTVKVEKGDISNLITATGTIEAIKTVDVGTQVSGIIEKLYVDFNSKVKKGDIIAKLDTTTLAANLNEVEANVQRIKAALDYNKSNFERIKKLYEKKVVADVDYDKALFDYKTSEANYVSILAQQKRVKRNLDYAIIRAPIDGVVVSRNVDVGQTVAASFNTPTLFVIANDLKKMQVEASIDEADIGQVKEGQNVEFTVDAFPDDSFKGTVIQKRLEAIVVQNVVTYNVIIDAPNPDLKLMPGMTANIVVYVDKRENVVKIPVQALRFKPSAEDMKKAFSNIPDSLKIKKRKKFSGNYASSSDNNSKKKFTSLWVEKNGLIIPRRVKLGLSDGVYYEVVRGLKPGEKVIIGKQKVKKSKSNSSRSPFMPKRPGRK